MPVVKDSQKAKHNKQINGKAGPSLPPLEVIHPPSSKRLVKLESVKKSNQKIKPREKKPLTKEEQETLRLIKLAQQGEQKALEKLVDNNKGLVEMIVHRFMRNKNYNKELVEELRQEGTIGLIQAIKKFDTSKPNRLSTYAFFWIRQTIQRSYPLLNLKKPIHTPRYMPKEIIEFKKQIESLTKKLGKQPTERDLLEARSDYNQRKLAILRAGTIKTISLDQLESVDLTIQRKILTRASKADAITPDNEVVEKIIKKIPTKRDRRIIRMHYGIDGEAPLNLAEIGRTLKLSRERVRQIVQSVCARLQIILEKEEFFADP